MAEKDELCRVKVIKISESRAPKYLTIFQAQVSVWALSGPKVNPYLEATEEAPLA